MSLEMLAQIRREELIADATNQRFAESVIEAQPPMVTRVMRGVGEVLTQAGEHLRKQALDAQLEWELKQCGEPHTAR
jgi:hypothetical protein